MQTRNTPAHITIRCNLCRHWTGERSIREVGARRCTLKGGSFFQVLQPPTEYCLKAEAGPNLPQES